MFFLIVIVIFTSLLFTMEDPLKHIKSILIVLLLVLAVVLAGCSNPTSSPEIDPDNPGVGTDTGDGSGGGTGTGDGSGTGGDGGGTGAGDVPPTPITITFELDMNSGNGFTLSTSHTAPEPITVLPGEPVRLTQGMGFTATETIDGQSLTYHASGWSTEAYSSQYERIMNPSSAEPDGGWYLPGFEATFTEDTTLRARWLPEFDFIAAQVTFVEPGSGTAPVPGPVLHLRDVLPFERTAYFQDAISAPWTVSANQRVWEIGRAHV